MKKRKVFWDVGAGEFHIEATEVALQHPDWDVYAIDHYYDVGKELDGKTIRNLGYVPFYKGDLNRPPNLKLIRWDLEKGNEKLNIPKADEVVINFIHHQIPAPKPQFFKNLLPKCKVTIRIDPKEMLQYDDSEYNYLKRLEELEHKFRNKKFRVVIKQETFEKGKPVPAVSSTEYKILEKRFADSSVPKFYQTLIARRGPKFFDFLETAKLKSKKKINLRKSK